MTISRFSLIDEPWIPVRDLKGNLVELGIRDTLIMSKDLQGIEDPSPLVVAALYRFLLAVLYRALDGPTNIEEAKKLFREGLPKEKIKNYLEKYRDRFWLFDDQFPFGQVRDLFLDHKHMKSWTVLSAESNSGNSKVLFDHSEVSKVPPMPPAFICRKMLAIHAFALCGGKNPLPKFKYYRGSPSSGAVMVIPVGVNFEDTMIFCLVPQRKEIQESDLAAWERVPEHVEGLAKTGKLSTDGYAHLYSRKCRSIRLDPEDNLDVQKVSFASGFEYGEASFTDPMAIYKVNKKRGKQLYSFNEKGFWRDFDSILPVRDNADNYPVPTVIENVVRLTKEDFSREPNSVMVLGQKTKDGGAEYWRIERYVLPKQMSKNLNIRYHVRELLEEAEKVDSSLKRAENCLPKKPNPQKNSREQIPLYTFRPFYWSTLEFKFLEILNDYSQGMDRETIERNWFLSLRDSLEKSWRLHEKLINRGDSRQIRSFANGDRFIRIELARINKKIEELE